MIFKFGEQLLKVFNAVLFSYQCYQREQSKCYSILSDVIQFSYRNTSDLDLTYLSPNALDTCLGLYKVLFVCF